MGTSFAQSSLADLRERLPTLMLRDERRLGRRIDGVRRVRDAQARRAAVEEITADVDAAEQRVARRRAAVPAVSYPPALPISERKDDILAAIRDHQVVIVAGETGSGKTTQIPKVCLELGRGVRGTIGHTQPRRLAARTVAERIAEELDTPLGAAVGYQVRFTDQTGDGTLVKLMTDGILLAEIQQDRQLRQYDTLIIDEAHERSLNIDFILGYLKELLPRRPDLKVIITSATIDPERFSRHFGDAPVIEVSGRTYPVEVRYRPLVDTDDDETEDTVRDQTQAICEAAGELCREGPGDILVFLSGEREIRDTADALGRLDLRDTEVLPLYARLSAAEQHRVFQSHTGRRIVLATNVAETSLTVPGIRYVIDPGFARISRYSQRTKVQRLPIEPISQASANQRKGRCGRVSEGICVRLYSEEDFLARPEFTDPEILRTNLASVILQMTALGLGDIAAFPFVEPPDRRNVKDGVELLRELGAMDPTVQDVRKRLTPVGRKLAQLPVDPRLGRMVLEADRNGCAREVMVIAAALSIQDPRERPAEKQEAAEQSHSRFVNKESDFLTYLNLWNYLREQQKALSGNQFRRMCKREYLNFLRIREWQDIESQLRQIGRGLGITLNDGPADPRHVHQSLLAGLLSHIGLRDTQRREYQGARNARFAIFPGSALFRKQPSWVMAAELVETSRLWGRIVARIEPEWAEKLADHLVRRNYSEPHWEKKQGAVMAHEKVTLYGLPIVVSRKVNYGRVDPALSRELFIRHALVEGDWDTRHRFFHDNRRLLDEVAGLEDRARRRDILVDDEALFDFYDRRVPADVVSARHFDAWWKKARRDQPDLLTFEKSTLVSERVDEVSEGDYPDDWHAEGLRLPVSYAFDPGTAADGVTVDVPLPVLHQVSAAEFSWHVPGLRRELVTALIRSLPKPLRRHFVPVPDVVNAVLARLAPTAGEPLLDALEAELRRLTGVTVPPDAWDVDRLPDHLKITFRVVDESGAEVAAGKDLEALKQRLKPKTRATVSRAGESLTRTGLRTWDFGTLPRTFDGEQAGYPVTAYPALADEGDSVAIRMFETESEQRREMWLGTRRLLLLTVPSPVKLVQKSLSNQAKLVLTRNPHGSVAALLEDCIAAAADKLIADAGGPAWDADGFARLRERLHADLGGAVLAVAEQVYRVLSAAHEVENRLAGTSGPGLDESLADAREQFAALIRPGFVTATGVRRLPDLVRYLQAIDRRLETLPRNPQRDVERMRRVQHTQRAYQELRDEVADGEGLTRIRWMIEELRVSYFAQALGTPYPVSDKRIFRAMDDLAG
jgi:ATP-dependent helicase HrpA